MTKIKDIRTSNYKWTGEIVPPAQNFCTNPTDALRESGDKMKSFRFHQWMVCEVIADDGTVGLGNAALAPEVTKKAIKSYLKADYSKGSNIDLYTTSLDLHRIYSNLSISSTA